MEGGSKTACSRQNNKEKGDQMKTRCELSEHELRKLLKVKQVKINFPRTKDKHFSYLMITYIILIIIAGIIFHSLGYSSGRERGYDEGYATGYSTQIDPDYEGLSLSGAIAFNIKHNLDSYIGWFGIVVGLGWILHGVGFRIA